MPYQLQVSAKILTWPRMCVCCCGTPDTTLRAAARRVTGKRVQRTTTSWWDVPYCEGCRRHARAFSAAPVLLVCALVAAVILWLVVSSNSAPAAWLLAIACAGAGVWAFRATRAEGFANLRTTCAARTDPMRYAGWHGSIHTFIFASRDYLESFAAANERKTMSDVRVV